MHNMSTIHKQAEAGVGRSGNKRKRATTDDAEDLDGLLTKRLLTDPHLSNYTQQVCSFFLCLISDFYLAWFFL